MFIPRTGRKTFAAAKETILLIFSKLRRNKGSPEPVGDAPGPVYLKRGTDCLGRTGLKTDIALPTIQRSSPNGLRNPKGHRLPKFPTSPRSRVSQ